MKQRSKRTNSSNSNQRRIKSADAKSGNSGYNPKFDKDRATNNPAWYGADPALLAAAASIPFSWATGTPINLENPVLDALPNGQDFSIPGVCALAIQPSVGWADVPTHPLNTAAFAMYSYVRHANSGHANYDAPDLMLYIMAMSQVYSYINFLQRVYGVATLYSQRNRYYPRALLVAMDVDPDSVVNNLANFRYGIQVLINKAASLYVPASMPIFARHASLYQHIYVEGSSAKDQTYLYVPQSFWKYTLNSDGSGMLEHDQFRGVTHTVQSLLNYGTDMLNRLIMSEDLNIMSGDILKAYGEGNIIKLAPLPENFMLTPIFDTAVLEQMKNAIAVPAWQLTGTNIIQSSDHGYLMHTPALVTKLDEAPTLGTQKFAMITKSVYQENKILTTATAFPSPDLIMDVSRLMIGGRDFVTSEDYTESSVKLMTGSEICTGVTIYRYDYDGTGEWVLDDEYYAYDVGMHMDTVDAVFYFKRVALRNHFKFRPAFHMLIGKQGTTESTFEVDDATVNQDVDNYAILTSQELGKLHEAALLSEFNVPTLVKI